MDVVIFSESKIVLFQKMNADMTDSNDINDISDWLSGLISLIAGEFL
jgi:hypothetical protein